MIFWFKKLISAFLLPLPFGLLWLTLGVILLLTQRARRLRNTSFIIGFLIITFSSLNPVTFFLLNRLQSEYTPLMTIPKDVSQVVVLGGGVSGRKDYPANLTLGSASLSRLVEGVRLFKELYKHNENAQLILSGGRVFQSPSSAGKMRNTTVMLGVNEKNTSLEDGSLDTHQEAVFLKKVIGKNPFILVTSAYHMPRAMAMFEAIGMHPIPAPTQFIGQHESSLIWYIPCASSLTVSDTAIHEYFGILWAKYPAYIGKENGDILTVNQQHEAELINVK